jgi:hypothetical protein
VVVAATAYTTETDAVDATTERAAASLNQPTKGTSLMNEVEQDAPPTDPQVWISGDMWAIDGGPGPRSRRAATHGDHSAGGRLTAERLAEVREEAGYGCVVLDADEVLALLDALADRDAALARAWDQGMNGSAAGA